MPNRKFRLAHVVPGDIIKLAAGDMIPADIRILSCKDLFIVQSSLTGESLPVEKFDAPADGAGQSPLELQNLCYPWHERRKRICNPPSL